MKGQISRSLAITPWRFGDALTVDELCLLNSDCGSLD